MKGLSRLDQTHKAALYSLHRSPALLKAPSPTSRRQTSRLLHPYTPCQKATSCRRAALSPPTALFKNLGGFFKGGAGQKLALKKYEPLVTHQFLLYMSWSRLWQIWMPVGRKDSGLKVWSVVSNACRLSRSMPLSHRCKSSRTWSWKRRQQNLGNDFKMGKPLMIFSSRLLQWVSHVLWTGSFRESIYPDGTNLLALQHLPF